MSKPNINTIKEGERVVVTGFTCIPDHSIRTIFGDKPKYICCSHGHHLLDGQADENGNLIGLTYVSEPRN